MRAGLVAAALLALSACGPNIKGLEDGERGTVAQVIDGDTLVLDSGLRVTLTGIEAPYGDAPFAPQARAALTELAMGRPARLAYGGLRRVPPRRAREAPASGAAPASPSEQPAANPNEGTALAQVFVQSEGGRWIWLQQAMLARGAAWARPRKDNLARAAALQAAEDRARGAEEGLWALRDYRVRNLSMILREELPDERCGRGPFRLVEGVVRDVAVQDGRVYFNFGEDYRTDFTIAIYGDDVETWSGPPFESYEGKRVRARGHAIARGGPLICADNPLQIVVLAE